MRLPLGKAARKAGRWLRSRQQDHVVILGYHQVRDERFDPLDLSVTPAQLDEQLQYIARHARPAALSQVVAELASGALPPRTVVITFDDGYEDTLRAALPLLRKHGVPATVFVTTGNAGLPFWWDALTATAADAHLPRKVVLDVAGQQLEFETDDRVRLVRRMAAALQPLDTLSRGAIVNDLAARWRENGSRVRGPRALTSEEIAELAGDPLIELGAHGVTHTPLAGLPAEHQRGEIERSRELLESVSGRRVQTFSYPHGSHSAETRAIVRQAGFVAACSSENDVATPATDVLALPRFWVDGDRRTQLGSWLERWL